MPTSLHVLGTTDELLTQSELNDLPQHCQSATVLRHGHGHTIPLLTPRLRDALPPFFAPVSSAQIHEEALSAAAPSAAPSGFAPFIAADSCRSVWSSSSATLARGSAAQQGVLCTEATLIQQLSTLDFMADVDVDAPLMESLNSLSATALVYALNNITGKSDDERLPVTLLFDQPTLRDIAAHVTADQVVASPPNAVCLPDSVIAQEYEVRLRGASCRLPEGLRSAEAMWQGVLCGLNVVHRVPAARWDEEDVNDETADSNVQVRIGFGAFVEAAWLFDNAFFNMSISETRVTDPQQRLLLEHSYEAFHLGGRTKSTLLRTNTGKWPVSHRRHCLPEPLT